MAVAVDLSVGVSTSLDTENSGIRIGIAIPSVVLCVHSTDFILREVTAVSFSLLPPILVDTVFVSDVGENTVVFVIVLLPIEFGTKSCRCKYSRVEGNKGSVAYIPYWVTYLFNRWVVSWIWIVIFFVVSTDVSRNSFKLLVVVVTYSLLITFDAKEFVRLLALSRYCPHGTVAATVLFFFSGREVSFLGSTVADDEDDKEEEEFPGIILPLFSTFVVFTVDEVVDDVCLRNNSFSARNAIAPREVNEYLRRIGVLEYSGVRSFFVYHNTTVFLVPGIHTGDDITDCVRTKGRYMKALRLFNRKKGEYMVVKDKGT